MPPRTNVRVEVAFEDAVVFAGETLSAVITFKNIAGTQQQPQSRYRSTSGAGSGGVPKNTTNDVGKHRRKKSLISLDDVPSPGSSTNGKTNSISEPKSPGEGEDNDQVGNLTNGLNRSFSLRNPTAKSPKQRDSSWHASSHSATENIPSSHRNSMALSRSAIDPNNEGLIMGFVQLQGYFELEDSIIETETFEDVKKHGIVLGQKGLDYGSNIRSGFFKGLTSGIGNFLGGNNNDSHNNFHMANNTDAIPIFSTPQSLLFVDLKLGPGESKSFGYQIKLPKQLPPSFRGKAIRTHYNLAIGTQKLDLKGRPEPKNILVPFRLFPHVDTMGKQPIHSLHDPIVQKNDEAIITTLTDPVDKVSFFKSARDIRNKTSSTTTGEEDDDLGSYISNLLSSNNQQQNLQAYTGPLNGLSKRSSSLIPTSTYRCSDNVEYFVKYQHLDSEKPFKSSFELGRGGHRIASASLSKPIFRVGEDIVLLLDFTGAKLSCYHVTASLETTEQVSVNVAKKSEQETIVATRRIFSQLATATFSTLKSHFDFTIPSTATPQFSTSVLSLNWSIKLDFITNPGKSDNTSQQQTTLFENTTNSDDHGIVETTQNFLDCETFSVRIPLQVYPTNQDIGALLDSNHINRNLPL